MPATQLDLTQHWAGYLGLALFVIAYTAVVMEERFHLRKSKPVMVAAGLIWGLIAGVYAVHGDQHTVAEAVRHNLLEYGELFLFLLAAMTYINAMEERGLFLALRGWLISKNFSLRAIFWLTGLLAFFISPMADNLTTALLMSTVVMTVAAGNRPFVVVACINIVVAANAGGVFSPFGDITTLMVWQKGHVRFEEFFGLFLPALVNWLVPALLMSLSIARAQPPPAQTSVYLRHGALVIVGLFLLTIVLAVTGHNYLHLPPVLGMMTGLGVLKLYGHYLGRRDMRLLEQQGVDADGSAGSGTGDQPMSAMGPDTAPVTVQHREAFNIFSALQRAEWDTLMFFYGVILCVGGLGMLGYLAVVSQFLYLDLGPTTANISIGMLSAIIDNIPLMYAVLTMNPDMNLAQWQLVTLTTGVGGSLLSIGSAAGVGVMGQARGTYTFFSHLKWSWAIALGYGGSIWVHLMLSG